MRLTERTEFDELERRCTVAMACKTASRQIEVMGDYLNANIPSLPVPLRMAFRSVISSIAHNTFSSHAEHEHEHENDKFTVLEACHVLK